MNPESIWNAARSGKLFTIKNVKITGMETYERPIGTSHLIKLTFRNSKTGNESVLQDVNLEDIEVCEKPKHDPCRLFKKGDVVEYRPKDGRANPNLLVGRRYKVSVDEPCDSGIVQVECDGLRHIDTFVAYNNLKLITPVEELEPYSVLETDTINGFDIMRDGLCVMTFPFGSKEAGYYRNRLAAKAAAEDERDRLNAECRKEQTND